MTSENYFGIKKLRAVALIAILLCFAPQNSRAYSVLTHEAIIDSAWTDVIQPALLKRFPASTPDDLKNAHAFAYGGAIIQDMGYYPGGSKLFSDLVHYVRSGTFVENLLRDSSNLNEYAFAMGAMSHYCSDNNGHNLAVNRAVPILYPDLRRKFGDVVTYDQNPAAHLKTEFGFDVIQVARGHYASHAYHDAIGFEVADDLLAKAFQETYGLELKTLFPNYDTTIGTFRYAVSTLIPKMTVVAWQIKKDDIQKNTPGLTRDKFIYNISRSSYEKDWSNKYKKPGFGTQLLAILVRIIPKVGPFKALAFHAPTPQTETLFMASFNSTLVNYKQMVTDESANGHAPLKDDNFDTGTVTGPGDYPLADHAYAKLVDELSENHFVGLTPDLRAVIVAYYADMNAPFATKKNKKKWNALVVKIGELKTATPAAD
nr:zinc dependent phospholipase C family protein [Candidatus Acidoferrales bacterium]